MSDERKLSYGQAFNEAVSQMMEADPDVFCAGEDIGAFGGVFGTFLGLQAKFGEHRVVDTPISEQAIVGLGVGASVTGLRPIVDLMFMDFICVALDQIVNQAAKLKYMFGGEASLPMTITTAGGGGLSAAAQHSQSLEALLCHIPGLKVVMPSNPYDMKGLMISCIKDNNPTVMIKHKRLLGMSAVVPTEAYEIPLGKGNILRPGTDVTIVAYARMANEALIAAAELAKEGIRLNAVSPGVIVVHTEGTSSTKPHADDVPAILQTIPMGRMGLPVEVAQAILWLLSSDAAYVTGTVLAVAIWPDFAAVPSPVPAALPS